LININEHGADVAPQRKMMTLHLGWMCLVAHYRWSGNLAIHSNR